MLSRWDLLASRPLTGTVSNNSANWHTGGAINGYVRLRQPTTNLCGLVGATSDLWTKVASKVVPSLRLIWHAGSPRPGPPSDWIRRILRTEHGAASAVVRARSDAPDMVHHRCAQLSPQAFASALVEAEGQANVMLA